MRNKTLNLRYDKDSYLEELIIEEKFDLFKVLKDDYNACGTIKSRLNDNGLSVREVKYWDCSEILMVIGTQNTDEIDRILQLENTEGVWGISSFNFGDYSSFSILNLHKLKQLKEK